MCGPLCQFLVVFAGSMLPQTCGLRLHKKAGTSSLLCAPALGIRILGCEFCWCRVFERLVSLVQSFPEACIRSDSKHAGCVFSRVVRGLGVDVQVLFSCFSLLAVVRKTDFFT